MKGQINAKATIKMASFSCFSRRSYIWPKFSKSQETDPAGGGYTSPTGVFFCDGKDISRKRNSFDIPE